MGWTKEAKEKALNKQQKSKTILCACGCGQELKELDKWGRPRLYIPGHNNRKYENKDDHKKVWWENNKGREDLKENRRKYKEKRRKNNKISLIYLLGGKCSKCGIKYNSDNQSIFDFHHKDNKSFNISPALQNKSNADLFKEVANKCILLCSNCHRMYHSDS